MAESYVIVRVLLTTAVVAKAILPAVLVAQRPVGISVIWPPPAENEDGTVIVLTVVVPLTKLTVSTGVIVPALASVGAAAELALSPEYDALS